MYCPKCGSENQSEVKFCTRCGANLAIVSDALGGKFDSLTTPDEREVKLLTDYYRGRRSMIIGFIAIVISVFKLSLTSLFGNPESFAWMIPLFTLFTIVGLFWFFWGVTKWNNCGSELKALGYDNPKNAVPKAKNLVAELPAASTVINVKSYDTDSMSAPVSITDSMNAPASVTEQTTRHLEEQSLQTSQPDKVSN
jgi:hypothetical protein